MTRTIKNFWKRSAGWVTALEDKAHQRPDIFAFTKLRLAILYFMVSFLVLLPFGLWTDVLISRSLYSQLGLALGDKAVADSVASAILDDLNRSRWGARIGGTLALFILSYLLAMVTLRPLKRAFDSQRHF